MVRTSNNQAIAIAGLPTNRRWPGGSFLAYWRDFTITYKVQRSDIENGVYSTCSITINVA